MCSMWKGYLYLSSFWMCCVATRLLVIHSVPVHNIIITVLQIQFIHLDSMAILFYIGFVQHSKWMDSVIIILLSYWNGANDTRTGYNNFTFWLHPIPYGTNTNVTSFTASCFLCESQKKRRNFQVFSPQNLDIFNDYSKKVAKTTLSV